MNCAEFQNDLHEYVEGGLPPGRRQAAAVHLAGCPVCQGRLAQERAASQALSRKFRDSTELLTLPEDFTARLLAAMERENPVPGESRTHFAGQTENSPRTDWVRFLWPTAIAACVLLTSFRLAYFSPGGPASAGLRAHASLTPSDISLHLIECTPRETFRRDGALVVDAVQCDPGPIEIEFHRNAPQKPL